MTLCWLIPNDRGGGVASVALSCCRQAASAGHEVTLLMALEPTGHIEEYADGFDLDTLGVEARDADAPQQLIEWLHEHPQDVLFFNGCSEVEPAIPHVPRATHSIYVVHDTAAQYWKKAVEYEKALDAIVAVSETVARQFRGKLRQSEKLHVLHNGTVFPSRPPHDQRAGDLIFMGGSKPVKGADDVLAVWEALAEANFGGKLHWFGRINETFQERVQSLPRRDQIVLHGRVPRSQIFEQAAKAKALLMLSRVEPFGMATVEAMGMGCVPVAWDIDTGTREIVADGETGFFAPLGDTEELARHVQQACARHGAMKESVIHRARTRFSEEAMWERYFCFIDMLQEQPVVERPQAGTAPPAFESPIRYFQLLPEGVRSLIRSFVARSPRLGYWLRDWRGM